MTYALHSTLESVSSDWCTVNARWFLVRRAVFSVVVVWLVLSATFVLFVVAPDARLGGLTGAAAFGGADAAEIEAIEQAYLEEYGFDRPVYVQYVDWMSSTVTLQWGESFVTEQSVRGLVGAALWRSAQYVIPATLLAVVAGVALGVYGALRPNGRGDRGGRLTAYAALGVPNFFAGIVAVLLLGDFALFVERGEVARNVWLQHVMPIVLLSTTLVGAMVSYTRASTSEYVDTAFIKLVRAKGASGWRVAGHVLKNAGPPLFALLFAELLAVLLLGVFVIEHVFVIDGIGSLTLDAVYERDVPVVLAVTFVVVFVGVVGNLASDVVSVTLDPRTER